MYIFVLKFVRIYSDFPFKRKTMCWWIPGASSTEQWLCFMALLEEWWNVYQWVRSKQGKEGCVMRGRTGSLLPQEGWGGRRQMKYRWSLMSCRHNPHWDKSNTGAKLVRTACFSLCVTSTILQWYAYLLSAFSSMLQYFFAICPASNVSVSCPPVFNLQ